MLERLAKGCALLAGALLAFMVLLTVASIVGRETIGRKVAVLRFHAWLESRVLPSGPARCREYR